MMLTTVSAVNTDGAVDPGRHRDATGMAATKEIAGTTGVIVGMTWI